MTLCSHCGTAYQAGHICPVPNPRGYFPPHRTVRVKGNLTTPGVMTFTVLEKG